MSELISLIMPVYNVDLSLLRKSINSVIHQKYNNWELIIVDDGAPSEVAELCDLFAKHNLQICVVHKENGGVSSARNVGIKESKGKYVFFIDSDDHIEENALCVLYDIAQKTSSDITCGSCFHINDSIVKQQNNILEYCSVDNFDAIRYLSYNVNVYDELETNAVWGKLYKRRVIKDVFFNENIHIGEDFLFNLNCLLNSNTITYCNQKIYNYVYVKNSLSNNREFSPKKINSLFELACILSNYADSKFYSGLIARCVNIAFSIYLKVPSNKIKNCKKLECFIKKYRNQLIFNKHINKKLRFAVCLSFLGFSFERFVFNCFLILQSVVLLMKNFVIR